MINSRWEGKKDSKDFMRESHVMGFWRMNRSLLVDKRMGSGQLQQRIACARVCLGLARVQCCLR